jgi:iron complex outermembrane receptor protein
VLRGEALERPGASLAELVADAPGVQIRRTGSDSDLCTASLRGATAAQTPVYLAGVRLNDDVTGVADLSTVPPFLIHRIEVYRGNAPAEADRLGIGGAILIEPRLPRGPSCGWASSAGATARAAPGSRRRPVTPAAARSSRCGTTRRGTTSATSTTAALASSGETTGGWRAPTPITRPGISGRSGATSRATARG